MGSILSLKRFKAIMTIYMHLATQLYCFALCATLHLSSSNKDPAIIYSGKVSILGQGGDIQVWEMTIQQFQHCFLWIFSAIHT